MLGSIYGYKKPSSIVRQNLNHLKETVQNELVYKNINLGEPNYLLRIRVLLGVSMSNSTDKELGEILEEYKKDVKSKNMFVDGSIDIRTRQEIEPVLTAEQKAKSAITQLINKAVVAELEDINRYGEVYGYKLTIQTSLNRLKNLTKKGHREDE